MIDPPPSRGRPSLVSITDGMFAGGAKIVFVGARVSGVSIKNNLFMGGGREKGDGDCAVIVQTANQGPITAAAVMAYKGS